ncbi:MAG: zinc ABC transporter substrate-binding protein, partial [Planctomycetota bacterium]
MITNIRQLLALTALAALAALTLVLLGACDRPAPAETTRASERLAVVCTIGMVTDIVRNVAGEHADVTGLLPAGIDPHLYSPTRSDVGRILDADVVFYNGLFLEGKMTETFERAQAAGKPVVAVTERIDPAYLLTDVEEEDASDPHVWM